MKKIGLKISIVLQIVSILLILLYSLTDYLVLGIIGYGSLLIWSVLYLYNAIISIRKSKINFNSHNNGDSSE